MGVCFGAHERPLALIHRIVRYAPKAAIWQHRYDPMIPVQDLLVKLEAGRSVAQSWAVSEQCFGL